ncbi:MAG: hypothetical protein M3N14_03350 [Bacteroidota bacterium]|nr:hypothetical protein [Bacteroidota bacterium]
MGFTQCSGRSFAAGAVPFVATKGTKNAFSRNASLPHMAFALQIRQNRGCNIFAHVSHHPTLQQNIAMPCRAQGQHRFA